METSRAKLCINREMEMERYILFPRRRKRNAMHFSRYVVLREQHGWNSPFSRHTKLLESIQVPSSIMKKLLACFLTLKS